MAVCEKCKVEIPSSGCPRCQYIDSLPVMMLPKECRGCCPICLIDFEDDDDEDELVNELPCEHHFHKKCIFEWIKLNNKTCPLCRYKLPLATPPIRQGFYRPPFGSMLFFHGGLAYYVPYRVGDPLQLDQLRAGAISGKYPRALLMYDDEDGVVRDEDGDAAMLE
ncbi:hypothetical protein ACJIZ3_022798 [Penstemon smallii]|uniref:RING-type E3 ubiquitin transferase n=1 Tax=Penstemon smallii TaxID=265156 RepID=A0ABD3TPB9_9LAMI